MFAHTIEVGVLFGSNRPLLAAPLVLCFVCWRVGTPNAFRIGVSYVVHSVYGERFHVPDTYTGLSAFVCIHLCFEEKTFLNSLCIYSNLETYSASHYVERFQLHSMYRGWLCRRVG